MKLKRLCSIFLAFLMVIGNMQISTNALENEAVQVNYQSQNVSIAADKNSANFGDSITLTGNSALENASLQWQSSKDGGATWQNISAGTASTYTFVYDETNYTDRYRLEASVENSLYYSTELAILHNAENVQEDKTDEKTTSEVSPQADVGTNNVTYLQQAELYYGENATNPLETATVNVKYVSGVGENNTVLAGDTIQIEIGYTFHQAGLYNYGEQAQPLFDSYENSYIDLKLPEGLTLNKNSEYNSNVIKKIVLPTDDDAPEKFKGTNTYRLYFDDSIGSNAISDQNGAFLLNVKVEGNGTLGVGHVFEYPDDYLSIHTEFTIRDRNNTGQGERLYTKNIETKEKQLANLNSKTNDQWLIKKTVPTDEAKRIRFDKKNNEVTLIYNLQFGLDNNGIILTNTGDYGRNGRVPFDTVTLREIPTLTNRDGKPVETKSITITPDFGEKKEIEVSKNGIVDLPVDTVKGHNGVGNSVDEDAPYLSEYMVEIVYPYDVFVAEYSDENQDELINNNTVQVEYKLKGENDSRTTESEAQITYGEVTKPAQLTIGKKIVSYDGQKEIPYTKENFGSDDNIKGDVTFKITRKDSNEPVTLYKKVTENGSVRYEVLSENGRVTLSKDNSEDGNVEVYLDPGTYTVSEEEGPSNTKKVTEGDKNATDRDVTLTAGEQSSTTFYNKEELGEINIIKRDQDGGPLSGAGFTVYNDENCTQQVATPSTTGSDGKTSITRLPYGTYYVKETTIPSGYLPDEKIVQEVTISEENPYGKLGFTNTQNAANILIQKQVFDELTNKYVNVGASNYEEFENAFTLEKKVSDGNWEAVPVPEPSDSTKTYSNLSLTQDGKISISNLPVYEADGTTLITYRITETLPKNFTANTGAKDSVWESVVDGIAYTKEFTLEGEKGGETRNITLKNESFASLTVTKEFYAGTKNGIEKETGTTQTATFELYVRTKANGELEKVSNSEVTIQNGESYTFNRLTFKTDDYNNEYYLVEINVDGYRVSDKLVSDTLDETYSKSAKVDEDNEKFKGKTVIGPFIPGGSDPDHQTVTVRNVRQEVPVLITKKDSITGGFVEGAAYTLTDTNDNRIIKKNEKITDAGGSLVLLGPGEYTVKETTVPANYNDVTDDENQTIVIPPKTKVNLNTKVITKTLKNRPDPKITVTKQLVQADGSNTSLTDVTFDIYTKNDSGDFEQYIVDDNAVTITSDGKTSVQLPAGTYYLKEKNIKAGVLDPEKYTNFYEQKDGDKNQFENGYFGPFKVDAVTSKSNLVQDLGTITNYSSNGAVNVTKVAALTDGKTSSLQGAVIGIYNSNDLNNSLQKQTSNENGEVSFKDLPIYDEKGEEINYVIKEISAPSGYTASDKEIKVTLQPGEVINKDFNDKNYQIINQPVTSLTINKTYYNAWEYEFTEKAYPLPGVTIALYKKNTDGNYYLVETKTTNDAGDVKFENLTQKDEYVAVEVSIPDEEAYQYLRPENGKYLSEDYPNEVPDKIRASVISQYYTVTKEANNDENKPQKAQTRSMVNIEHWTQLWIGKYKKINPTFNYTEEKPKPDPDTETTPVNVNNAEFELYQQVVSEDSGSKLSFNKENCTLIGTYTSGTLYDENGNRKNGWFSTDILKSDKNIVYWLVETKPGIGSEIKPENQIILLRHKDTLYTNQSTALDNKTLCTEYFDYAEDQITKESIENEAVYGPGSAMFSTVRLTKWAGKRNQETGQQINDFTPLGNTTFGLYLADSKGNLHGKLDTLTTGLDNNITDENAELTAWASSKAFSWKDLTETYNYEKENALLSEEEYNDIFRKDEQGNGYVRVAIVEESTVAGYQPFTNTYYMYMYFQNKKGKTTEIFNDAFYVKSDNPKDSNLSQALNPGDFTLYPASEEGTPIPVGSGKPADAVDGQYRFVNWPIDNYAVTVHKYGYEVSKDTLDKDEDQLQEHFNSGADDSRIALPNVEMKIQYFDTSQNQWIDSIPGYDVNSNEYNDKGEFVFETDQSGQYTFKKGLNIGYYRIIEISGDPGYENIYNGKDLPNGSEDGKQAAYYFHVYNDNVDINMYNPKKQSLTVHKTDMDGNNIEDVSFSLKKVGTTISVEQDTDNQGKTTFTNLDSGNYVLSESIDTNSSYSDNYFTKQFKQTYSNNSDIQNLVNSGGLYLGYTTAQSTFANGSAGVMITEKKDLNSYIKTGDVEVQVKNPEKGYMTIQKVAAHDDDLGISGATFTVSYKAFDKVDGTDIELTTSDDFGDAKTYTTNENGKISITNMEPGVYKIEETTAPSGYEKTLEVHYVVITGGLNIGEVTVDGNNVERNKIRVDEQTFTNKKLVSLTVNKKVDKGDYDSVSGTFTFNLYDSNNQKVVSEELDYPTNKSVTFNNLKQGATYYLEEENSEDYTLTSVSKNGTAIQPENNGRYKIEVPDNSTEGVTVTATNRYQKATIRFLKVDGDTGTALKGAQFELYRVKDDGTEEKVTDAVFKDEGDGKYSFGVTLQSDKETFRIRETKAPNNYIGVEDLSIETTVKAGEIQTIPVWDDNYKNQDSVMVANRIMPNYKGAYVDLTKYDNVHEAKGNPLEGASFTVYRYDSETQTWVVASTESTDKNGKIHFVVSGGERYALSEGTVSGFAGLDGVWSVENQKETSEVSSFEGILEDGSKVTLYPINGDKNINAGQTYTFNAYNIPYEGLRIEKRSTDENSPTAIVDVYKLNDEYSIPEDLTSVDVNALISGQTPIASNIAVGTSDEEGFMYADEKTDSSLKNKFVAGDKVLVVETSSSYPIVKDNKQVQWFDIIEIKADGTNSAKLKNINPSVNYTIVKKVVKEGGSAVDNDDEPKTSLMTEGTTINYRLDVVSKSSNTYPLAQFVVEDQGLSAYTGSADTKLDFEKYLKEHYSYSKVTLGKPSHDTQNIADGDSYPIQATVTFIGFNGEEIYKETVSFSDEESKEVLLADNLKAKSVKVEYFSEELKQVTGNQYVLGQNFDPGSIDVQVIVDRQTDPNDGNPVDSIDKLSNKASVSVGYYPWNTSGIKSDTMTTLSDDDSSYVKFADLDAPKVSIEKKAVSPGTNDPVKEVDLDTDVEYILTITNTNYALTSKAKYEKPFLVDLLPKGTSLETYEDGKLYKAEEDELGGLTVDSAEVKTSGEERALFINFNGDLGPGESASVRIKLKVNRQVSSFGANIDNYVFAGSQVRGIYTKDNPHASSFMTEEGKWPHSAKEQMTTVSDERKAELENMLDDKASYGYVSTNESINWKTSSQLTLVKSAHGDADSSEVYTTDILSAVSNGGTMNYRLTVGNTSSLHVVNNLRVVDILPTPNDFTTGMSRGSDWALQFGEITNIYALKDGNLIDKKLDDHYTIYYYIGNINGEADCTSIYHTAQNANQLENDLNWTTDATHSGIRAFIVVFDEDVELSSNENIVVEYTALAKPEDENEFDYDALNENAYKNAVNNFVVDYSYHYIGSKESLKGSLISSNVVSNTIYPNTVSVGGQIWIDKNNNGIRDEGEQASDMKSDAIISDLLSKANVTLNIYYGDTLNNTTDPYKTGENWDGLYEFSGIYPAAVRDNLEPYGSDVYDTSKQETNDMLKVEALKTSQPRNYTINVSLRNVQGQFKVTKLGENSGYSREPSKLSEEEKTDNNFIAASGTGNTSYTSERFFLWSTGQDEVDKTKDIGLVPTRSLTIHKVAQDDQNADVKGATFTVYGPFEEDKDIMNSDLIDENKIGTYKTDEDGNITINDLLWYQKYVIVEDGPGAGYKLTNATATGQNIESITVDNKAAWCLGIPDTQQTQTMENMTVTNVREVAVDLKASKELNHHSLKDYTFEFKLTDENGIEVQTVENDEEGNIKFENVSLRTPGKHVFYMEEVQGDKEEITYSTEKYKATVLVEWQEDKGLQVKEVTYEKYDAKTDSYIPATENNAIFTNSYKATGTLDLEADKTVNNTAPHQTFTFTLSKDGTVLQRKENDENGNIKFDSISYDEKDIGKEYIYTVQEENVSIPGYEKDASIYTIKVKVLDRGNGNLNVVKTITKDDKEVQDITFNNTYNPTGTWTPEAYKVLNGRDMREGEVFSFGVFEGDTQVSTGTIDSLKDAKEGNITFTPISYTKESIGEHTYTIREITESHNGITVDGNAYTIKVKVEDVDFDGDLTVSVLEAPEKIVFSNTYKVASVDEGAMVEKKVIGQDIYQSQNFTFNLSQIDGENYDGVTMPENTSAQIEVDPKTDRGQAVFEKVNFAKEGTYSFRITEQKPSQAGFETYDQSVWTWTVKVKANDEKGKLEVVSSIFTKENDDQEYDMASFTNTYQPSSITTSLQFNKVVDSIHELPESKDFTFVLTNTSKDDGVIMPENTEKTITINHSNESVSGSFDEITFTKVGDYTFQIKESEPEDAGQFTYDKTIWNVEVTVEDEAGHLVVSQVTYTAGSNENTQGASFENQYMPNGTEKVLQVEKTLKGDDIPKDKTFEFVLEADADNPEGAVLPENTKTAVVFTPESKDVQQATFDSIQFTKAGEYHFTIREIGEDGAGYAYDSTVWDVVIEVVDHKGQLQVDSVQYQKEGSTNKTQAQFTNKYTVNSVDYVPSVQKKLNNVVTPEDKEFVFTLSEDEDNDTSGYELKDVKTSVVGQGEGSFDAIHFLKAGTYTFYIQEEKPVYDGYEQYDTSIWTLTLKVEDKDGQLEITDKIYQSNTSQNQEAAVFNNVYQPEDTTYAPSVHKSVSGNRIPGDGQTFRFVLSADQDYGTAVTMPDKTEISILVSQEDNAVSKAFDEIQFHEAGDYAFTIREINDGQSGYTYDDRIWMLQVHVEDQDGHLTITKHSYKTDKENATEAASFENVYQVKPIDYAPLVEKMVQKDSLPKEGQDFTFIVEPSHDYAKDLAMPENNEVTLHVNETGEAVQAKFDSIQFYEAGTYTFTIKEKQENVSGFTYDDSVWTLMIEIVDDQGVLRIKDVKYTSDEQEQDLASFINIYEVKSVQMSPSVKKTISGDTPTDKEKFYFELSSKEDQDGMILPEDLQVEISGEGQTDFEPITFTKAGTYELEVYEVTGSNEAYTYDTSVWTIRVTVTDQDAQLQTQVEYLNHDQSNTEYAEFENVYHKPKDPEKSDESSDTSFFTNATPYVISTLASGGIIGGLYYRKRKHLRK